MGCAASIRKSSVLQSESEDSWHSRIDKNETVVATLVRLDRGIASCEKRYPTQRLAIVTAELKSIQLEIQELGGVINSDVTEKAYAKAIHQIFVELHLYKRPMLAAENEDFVANVNRKEMHRLEVLYLSLRQKELQRESQILQTQLLRLRSLYREQQHLLESLWYEKPSSEPTPQSNLRHAQGLRDALATASMRLRAGAEYTQNGLRLLEEALRSWKLSSIGSRSGWERTSSCAEACSLLVKARCQERGARRVLGAQAAPRAARSVRLTLDYAFTDCLHDHK
ncbi:unnamed protein product [Leptosia nina]|uniref:Uncharacterized protein n=1 Tax=Leptosia nina TaxID=320188 RepID=A0AAV1JCA0_9NEOP